MATAAAGQANYNYAEALQKSLYFFEAQESGRLSKGNRVAWRGPAHLDDGSDVGRDLSGGWYDAGDHWKSNYTMAYAASLLAWTGVQYRSVYTGTNQAVHLMRSLRHVNDYFLRCIVDPAPTSLTTFGGYEIYIDVGGRPGPEPGVHSVWTSPEVTAGFTRRESLRVNTTIAGPDVAASMAAAMAASAVVFQQNGDAVYARLLFERAQKLHNYADAHPYTSQSLINNKPQAIAPDGTVREIEYRDPNAHDDRLWAKLWLHRAALALGVPGYTNAYLDRARDQVDAAVAAGTPLWDQFGWWRDLFIGQYPHAVLMLWLQTSKVPADIARFEPLLFDHLKAWDELPPTPGGLKVRQEYGGNFSLKWALAQCSLAMMYSDWTSDSARKARFYNYAKSQIDYALGDNPFNLSFVIGVGPKQSPPSCHHRGAHGWWAGFEALTGTHPWYKPNNRHILFGGLMAGPRAGKWVESPPGSGTWVFQRVDEYAANFDHYMNEVALDFNAGMQGLLAGLIARNPAAYTPSSNFPSPVERNSSLDWVATDREYFVVARRAASTSTSIKIEAWLHNQSAFPPRVTRNLGFRYYFTLESGVTPANVSVTLDASQGASLSPVTHVSGSTYYVEITFANNPILPNRIYQAQNRPGGAGLPDDLFRRSITFNLSTNSGTWDSTNDHSATGMDGTLTIRPHLPVYESGSRLEGLEPTSATTGFATYELWANVPGEDLASIPFGAPPTCTSTLTSLQGPVNAGDQYGARIRGFITAPITGSYTFWIAADNRAELWLSASASTADMGRIAFTKDLTDPRQWTKFASQKSRAVSLVAGRRYAFEVRHKESSDGDHVAVGWSRPGQSTRSPSEIVPGSVLSRG